MKKKPSAVLHMIIWGASTGFVVGVPFLILIEFIFSNIEGASFVFIRSLLNLRIWIFGFGFGAIPSTIIGLLLGYFLSNTTDDVSSYFTQTDLQHRRREVYFSVFRIAWVLWMVTLFLVLSQGVGVFWVWLLFAAISGIAATVASIAAYHYLYRLHVWTGSFRKHKPKMKNDKVVVSHLIDNTTLSDSLYDLSEEQDHVEQNTIEL